MASSAVKLDTATPRLQRLAGFFAGSGQGEKFLMGWGAKVRRAAQLSALSHGGRRLWKDIARNIRLVRDSGQVRVEAMHVASAQKQYGGPIRAKGKAAGGADALTIPIADEAEGQSAAKFALSGLHLYTRGNVLGYDKGDKKLGVRAILFRPLFALVRETKPQRPEPFMPDDQAMLSMGLEAANKMAMS